MYNIIKLFLLISSIQSYGQVDRLCHCPNFNRDFVLKVDTLLLSDCEGNIFDTIPTDRIKIAWTDKDIIFETVNPGKFRKIKKVELDGEKYLKTKSRGKVWYIQPTATKNKLLISFYPKKGRTSYTYSGTYKYGKLNK